jgi:two-component system chemotaxis response regulator CheY
LVDDSAYARRIVRSVLERAGYAVREASTGMGAIESYFLERPDVVLLDLTMEDMTGLEVLERLRGMDSAVRVIVLSADVQSSTEGVVRNAGAMNFLGKPAAPAAILEAVETAIASKV